MRQKPILHGRDHLPGGADPIPGLNTGGLTPWADFAGPIPIIPSTGGGDTDATVRTSGSEQNFMWAMVQTEEGTPVADGGTPVNNGTVLLNYNVRIDTDAVAAGDSPGVYELPLPAVPVTGVLVVATGIVVVDGENNVEYEARLDVNGRIRIPESELVDSSPPSADLAQFVRIGWPTDFTGANTSPFVGEGTYPMTTLG